MRSDEASAIARGGSPNITLMHVFVDRLRPDEIRDVTLYYGAMPQLSATHRQGAP